MSCMHGAAIPVGDRVYTYTCGNEHADEQVIDALLFLVLVKHVQNLPPTGQLGAALRLCLPTPSVQC